MQSNFSIFSKSRNPSKIFIKDPLQNQENVIIKPRSKSSQRLFLIKPENFTIKVKVINDKDKNNEDFFVGTRLNSGLSPGRKGSFGGIINEKAQTPKPCVKLPILRKFCGVKNTSELLEIKSFRKYAKIENKPAMCNAATNTSNDEEIFRDNSKIDFDNKLKAKGKKYLILDAFPVSNEKRLVDFGKDLRIKQIRTKSSLK